MSGFRLNAADLDGLNAHLSALGWLALGERVVEASRAGEGNMNCTLRLRTTRRSVICKQSRPWVEKYPHIPAPEDRILVEGAFYRAVAPYPAIAGAMPRLISFDAPSHLLLLEDLGPAADLTGLYAGEPLDPADRRTLSSYLEALHGAFRQRAIDPVFDNREMRRLNHEHIFALPLRPDNGLDLDRLTPGLAAAASNLQNKPNFAARVQALGELYLEPGPTLVHGDFFPGSWLRTAAGPRVIDPEFCFAGPPEFDTGVMMAHLLLAGLEAPAAPLLARQFAGVEIMRRLIGVAQLPLTRSLEEKIALLELSRQLVLS